MIASNSNTPLHAAPRSTPSRQSLHPDEVMMMPYASICWMVNMINEENNLKTDSLRDRTVVQPVVSGGKTTTSSGFLIDTAHFFFCSNQTRMITRATQGLTPPNAITPAASANKNTKINRLRPYKACIRIIITAVHKLSQGFANIHSHAPPTTA